MFVVTEGSVGCQNDTLRCFQRRQSWHHDNSLVLLPAMPQWTNLLNPAKHLSLSHTPQLPFVSLVNRSNGIASTCNDIAEWGWEIKEHRSAIAYDWVLCGRWNSVKSCQDWHNTWKDPPTSIRDYLWTTKSYYWFSMCPIPRRSQNMVSV